MRYVQMEGPIFEAVQQAALFPDAKYFVDAIPKTDPEVLLKEFPSSDLTAFINTHFILPKDEAHPPITASTMLDYIEKTWPVLLKKLEAQSPHDTLITLPHPHIVPGGRFREMYYWDTYFTSLGLLTSGRIDIVKDQVDNLASLINTYGYIPNGNRIYYLTRSHPPFFSHLLALLEDAGEKACALSYFPQLEKEYAFWKNRETYSDTSDAPRPEAYNADKQMNSHRDIRASAESGWDFSSRFLATPDQFDSIDTTSIIPVDLMCLLYHMEEMLTSMAIALNYPDKATRYKDAAARRKNIINDRHWSEEEGFYFDYDTKQKALRLRPSLAGLFPLFVHIASSDQATRVAHRVEKEFLKAGGFVTTVTESGQQWDSPNGWAPLQWITIKGLIGYGHTSLAREAALKWLTMCETLYNEHGTLFEKYNVINQSIDIAQGEYTLQEGFGWTNGVIVALSTLFKNCYQENGDS